MSYVRAKQRKAEGWKNCMSIVAKYFHVSAEPPAGDDRALVAIAASLFKVPISGTPIAGDVASFVLYESSDVDELIDALIAARKKAWPHDAYDPFVWKDNYPDADPSDRCDHLKPNATSRCNLKGHYHVGQDHPFTPHVHDVLCGPGRQCEGP